MRVLPCVEPTADPRRVAEWPFLTHSYSLYPHWPLLSIVFDYFVTSISKFCDGHACSATLVRSVERESACTSLAGTSSEASANPSFYATPARTSRRGGRAQVKHGPSRNQWRPCPADTPRHRRHRHREQQAKARRWR